MVARPLVSVVIPTHNRAATLREALDSVYGQQGIGEQFDLEVMVVDDASTDETPQVVSRYPASRYIRHATNRGPAAARNTAIQESTGSLVALLDDDDVWLPHKLALQIPALEAHPEAGIVYSRIWIGSADSGYSWPAPQYNKSGLLFRALLMDDFLLTMSVLIRREVFDRSGYFDERIVTAEDYDLFLRAAFYFPFVFVPGIVAVYRLSPQGLLLSDARTDRLARGIRAAVDKALSLLPETSEYAALRREALARAELHIAVVTAPAGRTDLARQHLLSSLQMFPRVVCLSSARRDIAWAAGQVAIMSPSPIHTAAELSNEIRTIAGLDMGWAQRLWLRRLLAALWTEVALALAEQTKPNGRAVASAAAHAISLDPTSLMRGIHRASLLRTAITSLHCHRS